MAKNLIEFESGKLYHVYNRANGSEKLFFKEANYRYFIKLIRKYLYQFVEVHAYCLIPNHFHLLIRCKTVTHAVLSNQFRKLFVAYSKAINVQEARRGSLFMKPYKRKEIATDSYYSEVVRYIHQNPVKHGMTNTCATYGWSSYLSILNDEETFLNRSYVLEWFGGKEQFIDFHKKAMQDLSEGSSLEE